MKERLPRGQKRDGEGNGGRTDSQAVCLLILILTDTLIRICHVNYKLLNSKWKGKSAGAKIAIITSCRRVAEFLAAAADESKWEDTNVDNDEENMLF
jgi:hypothetical protein